MFCSYKIKRGRLCLHLLVLHWRLVVIAAIGGGGVAAAVVAAIAIVVVVVLFLIRRAGQLLLLLLLLLLFLLRGLIVGADTGEEVIVTPLDQILVFIGVTLGKIP